MTTLLNKETVARLSKVLRTAIVFGDTGIVEWVNRALIDAEHLGRLRDKDVNNLNRLEDTYRGQFYRTNVTGVAA